jgi:oxygen-independent coproporphyrinogen-3 oxidase
MGLSIMNVNFGKQNYFSKNNPLIGWEKYMGIGPGARLQWHFYWNVSNNIIYLKSIQEEKLPNEIEVPP